MNFIDCVVSFSTALKYSHFPIKATRIFDVLCGNRFENTVKEMYCLRRKVTGITQKQDVSNRTRGAGGAVG